MANCKPFQGCHKYNGGTCMRLCGRQESSFRAALGYKDIIPTRPTTVVGTGQGSGQGRGQTTYSPSQLKQQYPKAPLSLKPAQDKIQLAKKRSDNSPLRDRRDYMPKVAANGN